MAKKRRSVRAGIEIGGNVNRSNIVIGDSNVINIAPQKIILRSLHQFPQPPVDFTGREELIDQLLKDFDSQKGATISGLTGMGGIGKTALGLFVANQLKENYPDAQIFLDLKGTTEPLSTEEIARYVILSFEPTADLRTFDNASLFATYQSVLHGKNVLLFFDNARAAEQIAPLCPPGSCALLVTSRWTFSLPGLQSRRVDVMSEDDAKNFLLELCPRVKDKAADLAIACAYLPLALRISGSFLQVNEDWSVEQCLTQLSDRKKRLVTLRERHEEAELKSESDLLATFELSYNELSDEYQKLWRMLGVFPASFDASAAQTMWDLEEAETRKLLSLLRRYSLLDFDENSSRYSLHDLLADYAISQMKNGEEQDARLKHASHYLKVMNKTNDLYKKGGQIILQGLHLSDREWKHILSAQLWISKHATESKQIAELALLYPNATVHCINLRLAPKQQISWLLPALYIAKKFEIKHAESSILGNLGNAHILLGEVGKSIEYYEEQLKIAQQNGFRESEGRALNNIGLAYAELADLQRAIEFYERSLTVKREIGDRGGEGNALGNLGNAYFRLGHPHKAIDFHEQRLLIAREIGDRLGEGSAMNNLGLAYFSLNDVRKAMDYYEQRLLIAQEIGDRRGEGAGLLNLGIVFRSLGENQRAIGLVKEAIRIYEMMESPAAENARKRLKEWGVSE